MTIRAKYEISSFEDDTVYIVDIGGPTDMSVTNDAENVVKEVARLFPNYHIVYMDSFGSIDELMHEDGKFTGFKHLPSVNGKRNV